jgi:PAS domain S-box-containing protein
VDTADTILLVDDEPVVRDLIAAVLEPDGYRIVSASTAAEALSRAAALDNLGAALVDKNLPDESGLDLIRRLRELQPQCESIIITGFASVSSAIEAMKVGAFDYILKPFDDVNELRVKVRNALDRRALRASQGRLTRALSESEDRYKKLFRASSDAIIVYDAAGGTILETNAAAQIMYGYEEAEFRGLHASELAPEAQEMAGGSSHPRRTAPLIGVLRRQDVRKGREPLHVEVSAASFSVDGREVVVEVVRDITGRMRAEREKRELEAKLREAQKMEAIGRLAGGIAHDFNNVLVVVLNYSSFIEHRLKAAGAAGAPFADLAEFAANIEVAGQSAADLTRQLLAFSRRQVVAPEVLALNQVIKAVERLLQRSIGDDIAIQSALARDLWPIKMDRGQVEQLLLNLAVHGRDAMPGGGRLSFATENAELARPEADALRVEPGRYVKLTVRDTGGGIPADALAHIFEPFYTPREGTAPTGLGLATVDGIVEQARGKIRVSSVVGEGTTFEIFLPATSEAATAAGLAAQGAPRGGAGETILLVEDDDGVRKVTRQMLERAGYFVLEARQGEEGLLAFQRKRGAIDLVLTDVVMPTMTGRTLVDRLLKLRPGMRALYMSGYAADTIIRRGGAGEGEPFLAKPFTEERLLAAVRAVLDKPTTIATP